jgi:hypothetical protein
MTPKGFSQVFLQDDANRPSQGRSSDPLQPQPENASAATKVIVALIIGLLIGFAAGAFWQERRLSSVAVSPDETMTENGGTQKELAANGVASVSSAVAPAGFSLFAEDQNAGAAAVVARVSAREPVWVAVREERAGALGNILGAQKIQAGQHENVSVELLRPTSRGAAYFVVLYSATGTPAFNYRVDVLIEGVEGRFTAK